MKEQNYHHETGRSEDFLEILNKRHFQGALVRSVASVIMWIFALAAYLADVIKMNHFAGVSLSVLFLILITPPTLLLLKRITNLRLYGYASLLINFLEILGYTAIIYSLGGIEATFLTPIYAALITYVGVMGPRAFTYAIAFLCSAAFSFVVGCEYFGLIPRQAVVPSFNPSSLTILSYLSVVIGLLFVVAYVSSLTSGTLKKNRKKLREQNFELMERAEALIKAEKNLLTAQHELENRVEERTAELGQANDRLRKEIRERKQAEESLRENENQLRAIVEGTQALLAKVDANGYFTYANDATARAVGYAVSEELIGKSYLHFIHPEDRQQVRDAFINQVGTRQPSILQEFRITDTESKVKWFSFLSTLVIKDGQFVGQSGVAQDITERKQAEDALRESEAKYRSASTLMRLLCDNVPDMIWAKDLEKRYVFANKAICRNLLNAADTDEPIGKTDIFFAERERLRHAANPEWHTFDEICRDTDAITMDAGTPRQFDECGNVQGKFLFLDVHKAPFLDENGKMIGTVGSARDVTSAKEMEQKLKESEDRFRLLYESSLDAILLTAPDGRILAVNPSTSRMFEWNEEEIKQIGRSGLLDTSDPRLAPALEERNRTGKFHGELTFIRKSGARFPGDISSSVFKDKDGNLRTSMIIRDITYRKQAEAEKAVLETRNRLLQKAESLGRMAGAIAHNFNNQLQVVIGNLEMALVDQPGGSETLSEAMRAARKAAEVSALLLAYSGNLPGKHEPIDLAAVCRQNLALLQAAAPKGTILKADFPASGPLVHCNPGQIIQVLTNLVTNAWEAAEENRRSVGLTVMTVSQSNIPAFKRFPVDWKPQESVYACLEVLDVGCGIACKDIEMLFDPFFTTKFTGRGMGLSVVLGIVKAHNGGITVVSEPGRGSIFRVYFPLSAEEVHRQPDKPIQSPEMQGGATMLLIEDEEQVRKLARIMLTRLRYRVLEAKDGVEAVEIFQQHQDEIGCVLTDLTMPRMNGWDTLAALRKLSPDIPVILSSGYDEAQVMAGERLEQPNAFLGKPYRLQELKDTVRLTLAGKTTHVLKSNS